MCKHGLASDNNQFLGDDCSRSLEDVDERRSVH